MPFLHTQEKREAFVRDQGTDMKGEHVFRSFSLIHSVALKKKKKERNSAINTGLTGSKRQPCKFAMEVPFQRQADY